MPWARRKHSKLEHLGCICLSVAAFSARTTHRLLSKLDGPTLFISRCLRVGSSRRHFPFFIDIRARGSKPRTFSHVQAAPEAVDKHHAAGALSIIDASQQWCCFLFCADMRSATAHSTEWRREKQHFCSLLADRLTKHVHRDTTNAPAYLLSMCCTCCAYSIKKGKTRKYKSYERIRHPFQSRQRCSRVVRRRVGGSGEGRDRGQDVDGRPDRGVVPHDHWWATTRCIKCPRRRPTTEHLGVASSSALTGVAT